MTELQRALETLRPTEYSHVPQDSLSEYISNIFRKAELIANSVPSPAGGTSFESSQRAGIEANSASGAATLITSDVRRPAPSIEQAEIQKAWGKALKLGGKDAATGINVFKMAGHDRHGAWFARTSVHEGLGFAKWKRAMMEEFPESLETQGGPGEGNIRGIGGDQKLEDINVDGIGRLEVYQLSAQFPGPTAPREFITLLLTSSSALSQASDIGDTKPRHYIVVSIPVSHPDAPARQGMVLGQYESVELIREIPLSKSPAVKSQTAGSLSQGKQDGADDPEANPVEWIMVTRSDPGGGIPRFMVERSTPASIVQDAVKFLDWACAKKDFPDRRAEGANDPEKTQDPSRQAEYHVSEANGRLAGVGLSIVDRPASGTIRRASQRSDVLQDEAPSLLQSVADGLASYVPDVLNPISKTRSNDSISTASSGGSFASADQFQTAQDGPRDREAALSPSSVSETSLPTGSNDLEKSQTNRELQKIELKRQQLEERQAQRREQQLKDAANADSQSAKELEKAKERHERDKKKQDEKYEREMKKLEERRKKETDKLLVRQRKEEDKNALSKASRERDEWKERAELAAEENRLLLEQIRELQKENTALVVQLGKVEGGKGILDSVRKRAGSSVSVESSRSRTSGRKKDDKDNSVS